MSRVLVLDASYHNVLKTGSNLDLSKAHALGVRGLYARVADGYFTAGRDWAYPLLMEQARDLGWKTAGYWLYRADMPLLDQADRFRDWADDSDLWTLYPLGDYEKYPADLYEIWQFQIEVATRFGHNPNLYTNPGYWGIFGAAGQDPKWLTQRLHIAQYPYTRKYGWYPHILTNTEIWNPWLPKPWAADPVKNWDLWQFTAYAPGKDYGLDSAEADLSWFNGDAAKWAAYGPKPPAPPPPPPTVEDRLAALENIHPGGSHGK